jgi:enoyl-CoA hydratase/carnithine racemase
VEKRKWTILGSDGRSKRPQLRAIVTERAARHKPKNEAILQKSFPTMQTVKFERDNTVGRIVLANPPFNRLDLRFSECLRQAVHDASESDVRVVLVKAEGPHFSFGGEVREWFGKDINWFRTFVTEVNLSYRAIEALRVPTIAAVQGVAFGGGFELALNCDFIVAAENAVFRCVEVTTGMLPIAGALQRLAERVGRGRASRIAMLGEPISGALAGQLGIASHVVSEAEVAQTAEALAKRLAVGPTRSYATTRTLLKVWSAGGVPGADAVMLDIAMDLFNTDDCTRGFLNTAEAFDRDIEPPDLVFNGR